MKELGPPAEGGSPISSGSGRAEMNGQAVRGEGRLAMRQGWRERGQVGIVVVFTMIVVAAAVAWAVAAMATPSGSPTSPGAAPAPASPALIR
jgi:hypothetical protein